MIPLDHWLTPNSGLRRDHHTAIGELIASWAKFEIVLAKGLAHFITAGGKSKEDMDAAFIATTGMEARVKIGLMRSIFRYRFPEEADKFDSWADRVLKVKKVRDLAAHAMWVPAQRRGYVRAYGMTSVGKIKLLQVEYAATDFRKFSNETGGLLFDLAGFFWRQLGIILLPTPKTRDRSDEARLLRRVMKAVGTQKNEGPQTRRKSSARRKVPAVKTQG